MVVSAGRFLWFLIRLGLASAIMVGSMSLQPVFSRYQIITDAWENTPVVRLTSVGKCLLIASIEFDR